MKCPVCSNVYPDTLSRCSRCGRVAAEPARGREPSSTLIEFPAPRQPAPPSLPDWRVELNEKVRAIKARRNMEALVTESGLARQSAPEPEPEESVHEPLPSEPDEPSNPIVAAALDRVRRASANAARVATNALPARAHAGAALPRSTPSFPEREGRVIPLPAAAAEPRAAISESREVVLEAAVSESGLFDPAELLDGLDLLDDFDVPEFDATPGVVVVTPPAAILSRVLAAAVDVGVLAVASLPFLATTYALDGDFGRPAVQLLLGSTLALLVGFYLFVTLAISSKTIGMMAAGLKVVDASGQDPAPRKLLVRILGYAVAAAPAGIGFAWAVVHPGGCGWHDLLSGTRVVDD